MKRELISEAVTLRLVDVRKRVETLDPHHYGELSKFVSGVKDGLLDSEFNGNFQSTGWKTRDGKLLFASTRGVRGSPPGFWRDKVD